MTYEDFKVEIYKITGIHLSSYKEKQMKRRIDALISKNNFLGYDEYIPAVKKNSVLLNEFINHITINVSEFYRNPDQWLVLEKEIYPFLLQTFGNINIWSSACSTGDEPYTLVMVLNKFIPLEKIKIIATDIDEEILRKAKNGVYSEKSIHNLPEEFKNKYFNEIDGSYQVKDEIKKCVTFKKLDLLKDEYPKNMNLIVCRNVLIYFTEEAKEKVYSKFSASLVQKGILFVGSTEQIILPYKYSFKSLKTFYYSKEPVKAYNF